MKGYIIEHVLSFEKLGNIRTENKKIELEISNIMKKETRGVDVEIRGTIFKQKSVLRKNENKLLISYGNVRIFEQRQKATEDY